MGFKVSGLSDLMDGFDKLAQLPLRTKNEMLNAGADVLVKEQQRTAKNMLRGEYSIGQLAESITRKKPRATKDGNSVRVVFEGEAGVNVKTPMGYIAFINEFGKTNQPARPFIKTAIENSADEVAEAEGRVLDDYIDSIGF